MILETERLVLRALRQTDFSDLCKILQDEAVMYAYEHAFSDGEVQDWLERQLERYRADGFGLWGVIKKETDELIGQCGLTWQDYNHAKVLEVGYLFQKAFWHQGYATESAIACKEYAFTHLSATTVYSIIRDTNIASQAVARRNGMVLQDILIKHYYGVTMPHLVFCVDKIAAK